MITCPHCGARRRQGNWCRKCDRVDLEALRSIQISPAISTTTNNVPPRTPNNSFEKGVRKDERGIAYLDKDASPVHLKDSFNPRHYERSVRGTN